MQIITQLVNDIKNINKTNVHYLENYGIKIYGIPFWGLSWSVKCIDGWTFTMGDKNMKER